jgi:tartrate-resistant acid phosphatase type 5
MNKKIATSNYFLAFILLVLFPFYLKGQTSATNKLIVPEKALNFILLGDWGRYGDDHQLKVAAQLVKTSKQIPISFFISAGDNFYPRGVASTQDPHWHYSFEEIYKDFSLQREWFVILGNHDYMGNPDAQVEYTKISRRWQLPARYYSRTFGIPDGSGKKVQIAFIDTNPLIPAFYQNSEYGPNVRTQDTTAQKQWLKEVLSEKEESVKWSFVVGHHPMFTGSEKRREWYDTKSIRSSLKDLFETSKIDAYLTGHEHSLQHLQAESGVHHFISGSASEATEVSKINISKFSASVPGFLLFSVTADQMVVHAISHKGNILYRTVIPKVSLN